METMAEFAEIFKEYVEDGGVWFAIKEIVKQYDAFVCTKFVGMDGTDHLAAECKITILIVICATILMIAFDVIRNIRRDCQ